MWKETHQSVLYISKETHESHPEQACVIWKETYKRDLHTWKETHKSDLYIWKKTRESDLNIWKKTHERDQHIWKQTHDRDPRKRPTYVKGDLWKIFTKVIYTYEKRSTKMTNIFEKRPWICRVSCKPLRAGLWHVKREIWNRPTKETYIYEKRPTKET